MLLTTYQSHVTEWACLAVVGTFFLIRFGRYVPSTLLDCLYMQGSKIQSLVYPAMGCLLNTSFVKDVCAIYVLRR